MILNYGEQEFDVPPEQWAVVHYPNDLLDGMLIDIDDTQYAFVSVHYSGAEEFISGSLEDGATEYDMSEVEGIDFTQAPHSWVFASVVRTVIGGAIELCVEAAEE